MYQFLNKKINHLTCIEYLGQIKSNNRRFYIKCKCDCGKEIIVLEYSFRLEQIKGCGCYLSYNDRNIKGKKFGKLTVINLNNSDKKHNNWVCLCDCGNNKIVRASSLIKGITQSCGCLQKRTGKENPFWKGWEEISGEFFSSIKKGAEERNIEFKITIEYIWKLFIKQDKKCILSGVELNFQSRGDLRDGTASLDRIDSDKGYTEDNVQWVHKDLNLMKLDFKQKEFIKWCELVYKHSLK